MTGPLVLLGWADITQLLDQVIHAKPQSDALPLYVPADTMPRVREVQAGLNESLQQMPWLEPVVIAPDTGEAHQPGVLAALQAYEEAHAHLFAQCCSNPVRNAWGNEVDMTKLNHAHELAQRVLRGEPGPAVISIQEAWEAAGGNPGITPGKEELLTALRLLDEVCDEADRPGPGTIIQCPMRADFDPDATCPLCSVIPSSVRQDWERAVKRTETWDKGIVVNAATILAINRVLANAVAAQEPYSADPAEELRETVEPDGPAQPQGAVYHDARPDLHVGDSAFESWFQDYNPAGKGDKQKARDAYAAGMGDPLLAQPQGAGEAATLTVAQVIDWVPMPEDVYERKMFDDTVSEHGSTSSAISWLLRVMANNHPQGTFAQQLAIMANEMAKMPYTTPPASQQAENRELRRMLCVAHCGGTAYLDDGEAQDNGAHPAIDYLRDSLDEIKAKRMQRASQQAAPAGHWSAEGRGHPKRTAEEWQEIAELEDLAGGVFAAGALFSQQAAQAVPADSWPKLEKPATVGAATFGVGVSTHLVVDAAQRAFKFKSEQAAATREEMQEEEARRRKVWDMIHGAPADLAAQAVPDWNECLRISEVPAVDEALRNFSDDATENNAVCIVQEVFRAAKGEQ
jgi:hypothetical protein